MSSEATEGTQPSTLFKRPLTKDGFLWLWAVFAGGGTYGIIQDYTYIDQFNGAKTVDWGPALWTDVALVAGVEFVILAVIPAAIRGLIKARRRRSGK